MPAAPLTHHEILALVAPFARRERHVDLAASDRGARRLLFRPIEHPASAGLPALRETLQMDCFSGGGCRLTRRLDAGGPLQATLEAVGAQAGTLLEQMEQITPGQQFHCGAGYSIARSYALEAGEDGASWRAQLADATVLVDGLRLALRVPSARGAAADLALRPAPGVALELPEDLLAVLGWDWARLIGDGSGWRSKLRLRGNATRRSSARHGTWRRPWRQRPGTSMRSGARRAGASGCGGAFRC